MRNVIIKKFFFLVFLFTLQASFSLELVDIHTTLQNVFSNIVGSNEGSTGFPVLSIPFGGRCESFGTAYSALSQDVSFFDYNPAGSANLENKELALFHNSWIADSALETIAFSSRKGDLGYGAALKVFYVPFTEYNIFGESVSNGYYSESVAYGNIAYTFLSGYDFKGITVGANLKAVFRSVPDYTDSATDEIIPDSGLSQSAFGLMTDVGMQMQFNFLKAYSSREANCRFSFVVQNLGVSLTGFSQSLVFDDALPTKIVAGFSYKPIRPLLFAIEFRQPVNLKDFSATEQWEAGFGFGVNFTDFFTLQMGSLFIGGYPRFSLGASIFVRGLWFDINYSLDITSSLNPLNRISLAAKFNLGDEGRKEQARYVDELYKQGLQFYTLGYMKEAITTWETLLKINPRIDPAKRGIEAAKKAQVLLDQIIEIQKLD
ncbi:MAG: UPF0164 family protein [Spirochaetaceae bacterium]|nr:UPF0164 family protein [Spirochaetaceae bacterium]